ncbi:ribonuclease H-like domain-containing protein [Lentinula raphanica]|nr:ribonuclease H-like domain-containing protein [Lentinula raphanica]
MMSSLELKLSERDIRFDRNGNRVRCFPHVINIAVKTGLSFVTTLPSLRDGDTDDDGQYRDALASDLIARVRHLVNLCRASGNRRDDFCKTVLGENATGNDIDDADDILLDRVVVLLRDVDTRWSSTFFMVDRFLELYPAIQRFIENDTKLSNSELFSSVELEALNDIREFLHTFHSIQELASAEKTPTLSIVLPLYEGLIEILELMKDKLPNLSHIIDVSLDKLREYLNKARSTHIYGLAMGMFLPL